MDGAILADYLARLETPAPPRPDAAGLHELQLRHLRAVPFENLSIHLGEEIVLEPEPLSAKIARQGRGGICYELNGAFAALLTALGFEVSLLAARVHGQGGLSPLFDHVALRVDAPEPHLADVGFGAFSHHPLRLDLAGPQADPGGEFQIVAREHGDLDVHMDGVPQYRLESRPRQLAEFVPTCWWHRTSPQSPFTRSLTCSRLTPDGRVTLSGRRLIRTIHGERHERVLGSEVETLAAYRSEFGIVLDREPQLRV